MSNWDEVALPDGWELRGVEETDSTNDEIRRRGMAKHGLVAVAERQTAGRGRRGAAWLSNPGESLTFSVMLRPDGPKTLWSRLSLAAGLAVAEALETCGIEARIKWPNDVLVGTKKICGILVEAVGDHVIVGIGLNVGSKSFPEGLKATSILLETGREWGRPEVMGMILRSLSGWSGEIEKGFPNLIVRIQERCALSGEKVRLMSGDRMVEGRVAGIGMAGELLLETEQGQECFLQAHEVRLCD
ncbi:MAG: biotin--[acetyl-CoA-carboxylase] ligase [Verrucomicrobiota bacterium]